MSLPSNYRQVAMMGPAPSPGATHVYMPATTHMSNILKERLARTPSAAASSSSSKGVGEANVPSPFSTPSHGNPSFTPQKMGTGKGAVSKQAVDGRIPKPPKAPDKPLMPYMRYSRKVWDQVKAANTELKLWEIGKIIGSMWRDLPEADKQDFVDEYESEKVDYEKALKTYHASPSYQAYLNAKSRGAVAPEEKEVVDRTAAATTTKLDRRIDIQPAEDEEGQYYDDGLSMKQVSHSRYSRNHRLINEIFSETVVPDVRSVVTSQRLTVLKRQVQSLTMHQKKLETELQQIEEKFEAKKRKFIEAGDNFQLELKKVKAMAPKLDEGSFAAMVERQKEVVRRETEDRQRTAQGLPPRPPSTSSSTSPSPSSTTTIMQALPCTPIAATATAAVVSSGGRAEEGTEATGPAPQNTATLVDATPPTIQESSESGGDVDSKGEACTDVMTTTTTPPPPPSIDVTSTTTTTTTTTNFTTTTTNTTTAVNGPTPSTTTTTTTPTTPIPPTQSGTSTPTLQLPTPTPSLPQLPTPTPSLPTPTPSLPQLPTPTPSLPKLPTPTPSLPTPTPSLPQLPTLTAALTQQSGVTPTLPQLPPRQPTPTPTTTPTTTPTLQSGVTSTPTQLPTPTTTPPPPQVPTPTVTPPQPQQQQQQHANNPTVISPPPQMNPGGGGGGGSPQPPNPAPVTPPTAVPTPPHQASTPPS
ncbi:hypothetical protein Pcinc_016906 [Petrolisthes cinctipes]|uniref:HMG box domain-containing protein n=1 Tax=Petrolisthes cinctipes TaxID=88211 RepID=A0AAE1FQ59_PETCI|nr:hypothetical protein Pcinc_016906 [Petrolisthes cinctipes]